MSMFRSKSNNCICRLTKFEQVETWYELLEITVIDFKIKEACKILRLSRVHCFNATPLDNVVHLA